MSLPEASILSWSVKVPGIVERAEQERWIRDRPPVDRSARILAAGLPAGLRRRCSSLTRLSVEAGLDCCREAGVVPGSVATVLACRHGEISTTVGILETITREEGVSPARFINSVHHTALGYFDLCTGNTNPSRAVSGGSGSFGYGFLESLALLARDPARPVLLISGEDEVPEPFHREASGRDHPWAAAVLLGVQDACGDPLRLEYFPEAEGAHGCEGDGLDFVAWWLDGSPVLNLGGGRHRWRWERK